MKEDLELARILKIEQHLGRMSVLERSRKMVVMELGIVVALVVVMCRTSGVRILAEDNRPSSSRTEEVLGRDESLEW